MKGISPLMSVPHRLLATLLALALWSPLCATAAKAAKERYEITITYETKSETSDDSGQSSSSGGFLYIEVAIPFDNGCVERLFDAVDVPGKKRPLAEWKLPIRVRQCGAKPMELANEEAMIARLEKFLNAIEATREACGRYYFTWNVFQIDCDTKAALDIVQDIDLSAQPLFDGAEFTLDQSKKPALLRRSEETRESVGDQKVWVAEGMLDPAKLRAEAIDTVKIVAEINGKMISTEEASKEIAGHQFTGTFRVVFQLDQRTGTIIRTLTQTMRETDAQGVVTTRNSKRVTKRRKL